MNIKMNRCVLPLFLTMATILMTGCTGILQTKGLQSKVPISDQFYPLTRQKYLQAAHHWDLLAEDVSKQISTINSDKAIYVSKTTDSTEFDSAFRNMLVTQLHKNGLKISKNSDSTNVLEFNTQLIEHKDRSTVFPVKGSSFALIGGAYGIAKLVSDASWPIGLAMLTAADYASSGIFDSNPVTEVIVTTSVYENDILLKATTGVYFIRKGDSDHYKKENNLQVVSK